MVYIRFTIMLHLGQHSLSILTHGTFYPLYLLYKSIPPRIHWHKDQTIDRIPTRGWQCSCRNLFIPTTKNFSKTFPVLSISWKSLCNPSGTYKQPDNAMLLFTLCMSSPQLSRFFKDKEWILTSTCLQRLASYLAHSWGLISI